ncbi:hypothetical protein LTR37_001935 [Vermiconidia calcicola]|uniref:Uncharacterized protein n=1 Tax=Vermiconidia calcicola TaxID=1690605 RepID=A0ACC3NU47_9PEZI|nr:hypothetical protein LTR37_001935 [Vermiconidia calcicola]
MEHFRSTQPAYDAQSSLRLPAQKRIAAPTSERLTKITEGQGAGLDLPPPIPRKSSRRHSASQSISNSLRASKRESAGTQSTGRTPPPPYEWVPEPIQADDPENGNVVDERLEKLRRGEPDNEKRRRGGSKRLAIISGVVLVVVIALAVGLGVGLTRKEQKSNNDTESQSQGAPSNDSPPQKFPLGEYSLVTALKSVDTTCTFNPATWRCFPPNGSTNTTSLASFNWVFSNTSSTYATENTAFTSKQGVPANLTVSTRNDPFGIAFADQPLTYISAPSNSSTTRYSFSFTMPRTVIPSPAITADNAAAECFFNQTVFTANLYLSTPRTFPSGKLAMSTTLGGYEQWPYAVEITQSAVGGTDVPNCYETVDGRLGTPIEELIPQPETAECLCSYQNF